MKKVFPFILLITVMALSCKKDDGNGGGNGAPYPTDNLTLEAKTNSFMLVPYAPGSQSSITSQILAKEFENKYGDLFTHLNMVAGVGHPFYSFTADSILKHFGNPPSFLLNGQVYTDFEVMQEAIELAELKKPVISVVHKVTENDTSWIVDAKIEFYKDTSSNRFTIETYMVLEVPGIVNGEIDLRFPIVTDVINQDDKRSFWTRDIPSLDSSEIVARVNDTYIHNNVVYKNFNKKNPFGTNLADINPLGGEFFTGDKYGTRYTPIRHFFRKPRLKSEEIPFKFEPHFITVVWYKDPFTGVELYVNSYSDKDGIEVED